MPMSVVKPIHFEDFGGVDFERLVFAYLLRAGWTDVAWHGQTGSDLGRDIIGTEPFDDAPSRRTVVQCVNRSSLTAAKVTRDMTAAAKASSGVPDAMRFICRANISSDRRDQVRAAAKGLGVKHADAWSGVEFEEHLRHDAEFLLKRFSDGVVFPDSAEDLRRFVDDFPEMTDDDALQLMTAVFDRPAFRTPFQAESHLPAFRQAIEDTIEAFNTGVWRTRDGVEIRRIPSRHHLKSRATRATLVKVVDQLDAVRRLFKMRLADGSVRHCDCGDEACPTFIVSDRAAQELDQARSEALTTFASVAPGFAVRLA